MPSEKHARHATPEQVAEICLKLGFALSPEQSACLSGYLDLLAKWNRVMNLVGRSKWQDILSHLVVDSLYLDAFLRTLDIADTPECWDLGAGAGLPGIPLRMLWQKGSYCLVEAREKRALFLRTALASRPLPGVTVFHGRAEAFMPARPPADLIVSRAFMPWETMLDFVKNHVRAGSFCLFLTLTPLPAALPEGWTAEAEKRYTAGGRDSRFFWAIRRC